LDGFEQVRGLDALGTGEVGDGAGDFQNAVVSSGGEGELFHRLLEQVTEGGIDPAVFADLRVRHAGVGGGFGAGETGLLHRAGGVNPRSNHSRGFAGLFRAKIADGQGRGFDVKIDAVEQRAADAGAVTLDLRGRAPAFVLRIAEIAAGAGFC
jgi:hypothetical protein